MSEIIITQYAKEFPYEVFTIDDLYSDSEIDQFCNLIAEADQNNRMFAAHADFLNGKIRDEHTASLMYTRIAPFLPPLYRDRRQRTWQFVGVPSSIMYARVDPGQQFSIHTDTGCEYDDTNKRYSKYTVLTYLNDDFTGGCTRFYDDLFIESFAIQPKRNRTLIFDIDLFHSGDPVLSGSKHWIGTELVCQCEKYLNKTD